MTKSSPFQVVKRLSLRTDFNTQVVVEVSARADSRRPSYRIATFREWNDRGQTRRSRWLGEREMKLKVGLEESAMKFIAAEKSKQQAAPPAAAA